MTLPLGLEQTVAYDTAGFPTTVTLPGGHTVASTYDDEGNLTTLTLPTGEVHAFGHNALNYPTGYDWPQVGSVTSNTVTYTYNADRQLTDVDFPSGKAADLRYNADTGQLTTRTLSLGARSEVTTFTYGTGAEAGLLTALSGPGGNAVAFEFDGSLLTTTTVTGDVAGSITYHYEDPVSDFRMSSYTICGLTTGSVTLVRDDDGLTTQVGVLALGRDPASGLLTSTTLGLATDLRELNGFGEVTTCTFQCDGATSFTVYWTRDALGRITQHQEGDGATTGTWRYLYDSSARLCAVTNDGGTTLSTHAFDTNGNRTESWDGTTTWTGTYDAQDRLTEYADGATTNTYGYDVDGQLTTKSVCTGATSATTTYAYDLTGNLTTATLPNSTVVRYTFDALGRRIGRSDGATTRSWLYGGGPAPVAELDENSNVEAVFIYATNAFVPDYMVKGDSTYRVITDPRLSVRLVVNVATGAVVQEMEWDTWGNLISDTNPGFQPFGWAGGQYDATTGLHHFCTREYDSEVGRFITKDPILFIGGTNLYAYCLGDPVNLLDPLGLGGDKIYVFVGAIHASSYKPNGLPRPAYSDLWALSMLSAARQMKNGLEDLYPNSTVILDLAAHDGEFLEACSAPNTQGIVYVGEGWYGYVQTLADNTDAEEGTRVYEMTGDIDFFIGLSCGSTTPRREVGDTIGEALNTEFSYGFKGEVLIMSLSLYYADVAMDKIRLWEKSRDDSNAAIDPGLEGIDPDANEDGKPN